MGRWEGSAIQLSEVLCFPLAPCALRMEGRLHLSGISRLHRACQDLRLVLGTREQLVEALCLQASLWSPVAFQFPSRCFRMWAVYFSTVLLGPRSGTVAVSGCGGNLAGQSLCPSEALLLFLPRGAGGPLSLLVPCRCPWVQMPTGAGTGWESPGTSGS